MQYVIFPANPDRVKLDLKVLCILYELAVSLGGGFW